MDDGSLAAGEVIEHELLSVHVDDAAGGRLRLVGEADLASSVALVAGFDRLAAAGAGEAVVDCSQLTYLDSTGIRALVHGNAVLPGKVTIERPTPAVARILDAMALGQVLRIVADPGGAG